MLRLISRLPKRRRFLGLLSDTRGSELVEMAFALPILLVFMVGIIDFGGAFNLKHRLSNAVREAARFAASESVLDAFSNGNVCSCTPASVSAIRDVVANYLTDAGSTQCTVSTTATQSGLQWTFSSASTGCGSFSLVIDRNNTATTNGTTTVVATHVTLSYPYTWRFNKVIGLLVRGANPTLPATISSDAIMENLP